jgi:hypothetical protein
MLILGAMLACLGVFAFSGPAKAAPTHFMELTNGQINLGFAFKGAEILPAPPTVQLDDPPAPTTPLPDLWYASETASMPDGTGTAPNGPTSFKPAGCITKVTYGVYAAMNMDPGASPAFYPNGFVQDPRPSGAASGGLLVNPLANAGPDSDPAGGRTLKQGAIVPAGETFPSLVNPALPDIVGPYPAADIKWIPYSVAGLPPNPPTAPGTKLVPNPDYSVDCAEGNPASGTVDADVDAAGNVKIPANGFRFPIMVVPNPLDNSPVPITLAATGEITGTSNPATGDLSLTGPIEARVLVGLASNPLGEYCAVPLEGLTLSTTSNADFPGVPFTSGIDGQGALTGTYNITQNSTSVGGANCGTVDQVSKGAGSIWLSSGIAEPPVCPENTTGIPPNCEPIPCPAGYSGNEPDCVQLKAKFGKVKVNGPKKAKKGKKVTFKVKVKNAGTVTANKVKVKVSGKGASGTGKTGKIKAGKSKTIKVKVKLKKAGKIKLKFKVTAKKTKAKTVKKTIKVKK